jgi:hypothetical protein
MNTSHQPEIILGLVIFGIGFPALGMVAIIYGLRLLAKGRASLNWPSTQGHIAKSMVENRLTSGYRGTSTIFEAQIEYRYTIAGIGRWSKIISIGTTLGWGIEKFAERLVAKYPVGKVVDVFYNPENPNEAVLIRGTTFGTYLAILMGLAFMICGLAVWF